MKSRLSHRRMISQRRGHAGFTLIELMVVILIIAILAALLMSGILGAKSSAEDARTIVEIDQMAQAMEAYRSKYGDYPPIGLAFPSETTGTVSSPGYLRVQAHCLRAFQRYPGPPPAQAGTVNDPLFLASRLDPAESLVFWLGGVPITDGVGRGVEGFSANVSNPFQTSPSGAVQRTQPFFAFDPQRLTDLDSDGFWEFTPHGRETPYVYFRADLYASGPSVTIASWDAPNGSTAVPYRAAPGINTIAMSWASPKTFQIIAAGADDIFGYGNGARVFPAGTGYDPGATDDDNLTNFSRARIGRARP